MKSVQKLTQKQKRLRGLEKRKSERDNLVNELKKWYFYLSIYILVSQPILMTVDYFDTDKSSSVKFNWAIFYISMASIIFSMLYFSKTYKLKELIHKMRSYFQDYDASIFIKYDIIGLNLILGSIVSLYSLIFIFNWRFIELFIALIIMRIVIELIVKILKKFT